MLTLWSWLTWFMQSVTRGSPILPTSSSKLILRIGLSGWVRTWGGSSRVESLRLTLASLRVSCYQRARLLWVSVYSSMVSGRSITRYPLPYPLIFLPAPVAAQSSIWVQVHSGSCRTDYPEHPNPHTSKSTHYFLLVPFYLELNDFAIVKYNFVYIDEVGFLLLLIGSPYRATADGDKNNDEKQNVSTLNIIS